MEYFSNFALKRGWDHEKYGLQVEYLLTTALERDGITKRVYCQMMKKLRDNPLDIVAEPAQQRRRLSVQEELDHKQGEFTKRAKQCHALDPHGYAGKLKDTVKGLHDQRRQKMLGTCEAYILEVKGAQQALHHDQTWVDQRLAEPKAELQKAQAALEGFLREATALAKTWGPSVTPKRTPTTQTAPWKSQRIPIMERDVDQVVQDARKVIRELRSAHYQTTLDLLVWKSRELQDALRKAGGL